MVVIGDPPMLQSIRDRVQNWFFLTIMVLIAIAFAFWGVERFFESKASARVVAQVGKHEITDRAFQSAYQRTRRQLQMQSNQKITPAIDKNLKEQVVQQLIRSYVLSEAAMTQGYQVVPQQIDSVLVSIPVFQENGRFSNQRFQQVTQALLFTQAGFIDQLRSDILINQLHAGVIASSFVLPDEIERVEALLGQQRDISYAVIPFSQFSANKPISAKDMRAFYDIHQQQFRTPEQVSVSYVRLSLKELAKQQHFTIQQLKDYYQSNIAHFSQPAKYQIAQILVSLAPKAKGQELTKAMAKVANIQARLKKGESFTEVAKSQSDDKVAARKGGLLPWMLASKIDDSLRAEVKALKVGAITQPIRTQYGFIITKLIAKQARTVRPFAEVRNQIQLNLAQQEAEKLFASKSDELANLSFSESNSLQAASAALNLPIQTSELFTKQGGKGIANNPRVLAAAFSPAVLQQGYNSDVIDMGDDSALVLRVNKHVPSAIKDFSAVKSFIKTTLAQQQVKQQAQELAQQWVKAMTKGEKLSQLVKKTAFKLTQLENIKRHDKRVKQIIVDEAFTLANPTFNPKGSVSALALPEQGYAVVQVTKVMPGKTTPLNSPQNQAIATQLARTWGTMNYNLYVQQQLAAHNITVNLP